MHFEGTSAALNRALRCSTQLLLGFLACACRFGPDDVNIGFDQPRGAAGPGQPSGGMAGCTAWQTPTPVSELNTPGTDCGGYITPNGLTYYYDVDRELFVARRPDPSQPFSAPTPISELNTGATEADPATTLDELEIFFTSDRQDGSCIYRAARMTTSEPWGPATRLDALCPTGAVGPTISADGLTLYYNRIEVPNLLGTVMVATRGSRDAAFGAEATVPTLSSSTDLAFGYPSLSPDGLSLYISATSNGLDIWLATRADSSSQFATPVPVDELNGPTLDGDPSITADGSQLFFASARAGDSDIYLARRSCR